MLPAVVQEMNDDPAETETAAPTPSTTETEAAVPTPCEVATSTTTFKDAGAGITQHARILHHRGVTANLRPQKRSKGKLTFYCTLLWL